MPTTSPARFGVVELRVSSPAFSSWIYVDRHNDGTVPSGVVIDPVTWDAGPGWGWGAHILPFVEAGNVAKGLDYGMPIWADPHRELIQTQIPVFLCPDSSGDNDPFVVVDESNTAYSPDGNTELILGRSHYVASHGQESAWGPEAGSDLTGDIFTDIYTATTKSVSINGDVARVADGPFYRNSKTKISRVTDGTSNTIFLGEHTSKLSGKTWVGVVPGAIVHPRFSSPENGPDGAATMVLVHAGPSGGELDITRLSDHPSRQLPDVPRWANVFRASRRLQCLLWRRFRSLFQSRNRLDHVRGT